MSTDKDERILIVGSGSAIAGVSTEDKEALHKFLEEENARLEKQKELSLELSHKSIPKIRESRAQRRKQQRDLRKKKRR